MKTKDLLDYAKEKGYLVDEKDRYIEIFKDIELVALIGMNRLFDIQVLNPGKVSTGLFRRMIEYASTPAREREEVKVYRVELPSGHFLHRVATCNADSAWVLSVALAGEWTEEEIKAIDERYWQFRDEVTE